VLLLFRIKHRQSDIISSKLTISATRHFHRHRHTDEERGRRTTYRKNGSYSKSNDNEEDNCRKKVRDNDTYADNDNAKFNQIMDEDIVSNMISECPTNSKDLKIAMEDDSEISVDDSLLSSTFSSQPITLVQRKTESESIFRAAGIKSSRPVWSPSINLTKTLEQSVQGSHTDQPRLAKKASVNCKLGSVLSLLNTKVVNKVDLVLPTKRKPEWCEIPTNELNAIKANEKSAKVEVNGNDNEKKVQQFCNCTQVSNNITATNWKETLKHEDQIMLLFPIIPTSSRSNPTLNFQTTPKTQTLPIYQTVQSNDSLLYQTTPCKCGPLAMTGYQSIPSTQLTSIDRTREPGNGAETNPKSKSKQIPSRPLAPIDSTYNKCFIQVQKGSTLFQPAMLNPFNTVMPWPLFGSWVPWWCFPYLHPKQVGAHSVLGAPQSLESDDILSVPIPAWFPPSYWQSPIIEFPTPLAGTNPEAWKFFT